MEYMDTATIKPGLLSLVLQIARIAGAGPVRFKKLRNGYSISVTRFQWAYSFFVITSFNVIGLLGIFLNVKNKIILEFRLLSTTRLFVTEHMTGVVTSLIGYMAPIQMKSMIHHLNILEKIRTKTNYGSSSAKEERIMMWMCCFIIIFNFVFSLLEVFYSILAAPEYDLGVILFSVHYLQYNILIFFKIQIVIINFEVYKVFVELNSRLRSLFTMADYDHLTTTTAQVINNEVRSLTQCYISLCDVVAKINNADGIYIFFIYTCFAIFSVYDGYGLIFALNKHSTRHHYVNIILQFSWCIMIILRTVLFVEPFHRISEQVAEMKVRLTQLLYHMTPLGDHVSIELDVMIKQVLLNVPQYCPLGLITLNRSLITTTFSAITTFLVFFVQIQS